MEYYYLEDENADKDKEGNNDLGTAAAVVVEEPPTVISDTETNKVKVDATEATDNPIDPSVLESSGDCLYVHKNKSMSSAVLLFLTYI